MKIFKGISIGVVIFSLSLGFVAPLSALAATNSGTVSLSSAGVTDGNCSPVSYISGDTNKNLKFDPSETWVFSCGKQPVVGLPFRLKIPSINIDVSLESMGVTSKGAMSAPKGTVDAGWYNLGPRPGESGNAVIDGHSGWWKNGKPAVFEDLNKLVAGDKLYVEDANGVTTTFVIRESRTYDPKADASAVFNSVDAQSHLNLITCAGVWDKAKQNYSSRLVVFADKEI